MPRLNQIFHGISFRDLKVGQCTHVKPIDAPPFIRRCTSPVATGLTVCLRHSFSVTFRMVDKTERTKYFDSLRKAEDFRKYTVPNSWTEVSYPIPGRERSVR